jgi:hypothetical protein
MACSTLAFHICIVQLLFASFFLKLIYRYVPYMKPHQNLPKDLKYIYVRFQLTPRINWGIKLMKIVYKQQHS